MTDDATIDDAIKLIVQSPDDVTMLSAFLQDGLVAHHDIHFDQSQQEVMLVVDRYRWEQDASRRERVLMGLRIGKVTALLEKKWHRSAAPHDTALFYNLLNLAYEQRDDGTQSLCFTFSGGAALRLMVDDLMMSAGDIAPPRPAIATPEHKTSPED